ncbi:MAG: AAA family ATPase, partial [Candidatus Woesearchaeota archaeon]
TGKTEIAKAIAKKLKMKYIDVNEVIDSNNLKECYDKKRDTYVVDEKKLSKALVEMIKKDSNIVIDSHMAHEVPPKYINLCVVTKCDLKELKKRLTKRGYHEDKVRENMDAEIFDICMEEAKEMGHKILIIDTTKKKALKIVDSLLN